MEFNVKDIAEKFDRYLQVKGLKFSGIVVGGSALVLLDIIDRSTKDFDMIEDNIPQEIVDAALKFAEQENLSIYWLNSGPSELVKHLPAHWRSTIQPLYSGDGLKLSTLSRDNLIKAKIWAYCDRTKDYDDVISMLPSKGELADTQAWLSL